MNKSVDTLILSISAAVEKNVNSELWFFTQFTVFADFQIITGCSHRYP